MTDEKYSSSDAPLVNIEKLEEILSIYKFPLALASIGTVLLTLAILLLVKNQKTKGADVEFITEATNSARKKVRVDLQGAVLSSGVFELPDGSRVQDALVAAGGLSADADRDWVSKNLNRAAKLIDGGKIYIPSSAEANSVETNNLELGANNTEGNNLLGTVSSQININTASRGELESIKGIGPVTSQKIIDGRPYQSVEELKSRKILGQALYEKTKDLFSVY